ncbi:hypothetical protein CHH91_09960 [Virgibacillus sp. 7505]|uniref:GNAT family N-acetyltransferase n=1 Tax=Virgibacillus sp. 7505 TaxID=2022548 RepID=UPI000BA7646C|nr:GNAT family N-acetyltransferase [Virgibacillus sp. 7505]PAE15960.1 hypothetical protein CHH91_09960 [Virgibacillus sp. 7505]
MIHITQASPDHVAGIAKVCSDGYWATYKKTHSEKYIQGIIEEFYNHDRILKEVSESSWDWGGYIVALEDGEVLGAIGGGMIGEGVGEVFVLYLDPDRRNEGIGTKLLDALTKQQKEQFNATEQWVSVAKGNQKGIPFYEARGFVVQHERPGYHDIDGESLEILSENIAYPESVEWQAYIRYRDEGTKKPALIGWFSSFLVVHFLDFEVKAEITERRVKIKCSEHCK